MRTPRFEIFEGKNNEFFFRLKAKNGKTILQSEGYTQKHNAEGGIDAVRRDTFYSACFEIDFHFEGYGYERVEVWWFRAVSVNGEIIGKSETYTTKAGAKKGIESVRRCAPIAEIVDLTKD